MGGEVGEQWTLGDELLVEADRELQRERGRQVVKLGHAQHDARGSHLELKVLGDQLRERRRHAAEAQVRHDGLEPVAPLL